MVKRLLLAITLLIATPAFAQDVDTNNPPPPLEKEFGPLDEPLHDKIANIFQFLDGNGVTTHVDDEAAAEEGVGSFRFICESGQVLADDRIVYPGQPGASHAHQFYGYLGANAHSTYENPGPMIGVGTTCQNPLNKSAYWMPAMLYKGMVIRPDYQAIYYKRPGKNLPACTPGHPAFVGRCIGIPNGIRFIFGADMVSGTTPTGAISFKCTVFAPGDSAGQSGPTVTNIVAAVSSCPNIAGEKRLGLTILSPQCWDGKNLDSPNHRSHTSNVNPATGKCPATHPYLFPQFSLTPSYLIPDDHDMSPNWYPGRPNTMHLSSDSMFGMPEQMPGTTFHADYDERWNNAVKKMWTDHCIDKNLNCSGGDLGNGYALKQLWPLDYLATPRIVPKPTMRREPFNMKVKAQGLMAGMEDQGTWTDYIGVSTFIVATVVALLIGIATIIRRRRQRHDELEG